MTADRALFFDLDGTLTDPKIGIVGCIRHALARLDVAAPADDDLTWCIGPPLRESFATLLGGAERAEAALGHYRDRFATIGLYENTVYDGIPETLERLSGLGCRLYLATSKPHVYATEILAHFDLAAHLDRVFGSELDGTRADKRDLLGYALAESGASPAASVMIGDRRHDIDGGRHNGMGTIGVSYGYGGRAELSAAGAHRIVETPPEIFSAIAE